MSKFSDFISRVTGRGAPSRITKGRPLSGFIPRVRKPFIDIPERDTISTERLPTLDKELRVRGGGR